MTDTIPVQGPETQVVGDIVCGDFLALLNERDRELVLVLSSGVTKLIEAADILGYANHSGISKRLSRIRDAARQHFDLD
jgi:nitrogenase subunit NifH